MQNNDFFGQEELARLQGMEGKKVIKVLYTVWKNLAHPDGAFEVLEWVELMLEDFSIISFTADEEASAIQIMDMDFEVERIRVREQFGGQVALERIEMDDSPTWRKLTGQKVDAVGLLPEQGGRFPNRLIHLIFGNQIIEVALNQEGLLVTRGKRPR